MEQMIAKGNVSISLIGRDGTSHSIDIGHNTLSYGCADSVASLFSGKQSARPAKVVFAYGTKGRENEFVIDQDNPRVQRQNDIITGTLTPKAVDVDPNPVISSSDSTKYSGNVVTFKAMTTENDLDAYVYGFLLEAEDGTVLAAKKLESGVMKQKNYALSVSWSVRFI